jgi:hypothetical protein
MNGAVIADDVSSPNTSELRRPRLVVASACACSSSSNGGTTGSAQLSVDGLACAKPLHSKDGGKRLCLTFSRLGGRSDQVTDGVPIVIPRLNLKVNHAPEAATLHFVSLSLSLYAPSSL